MFRRLIGWVRHGMADGLDLLCPEVCLACDKPLAEEPHDAPFCRRCRTQMILPAANSCPRCGGRSVIPTVEGPQHCGHCRGTDFLFERTVALGLYEGDLRRYLLRMKTDRSRLLAVGIAALLWSECHTRLHDLNPDMIIPVPMHSARRFWRGVNGPEIIAEELATRLQLPAAGKLFCRTKATQMQYRLTPKQRRSNLQDAFAPKRTWSPFLFQSSQPHHSHAVAGKRILLVDDILTTGSTLNSLCKEMLQLGATAVIAVVIARSVGMFAKNLA